MCKIGILLIGLDLYSSASSLFQKLVLYKTGSYLDLTVHIIALLALLLAYRGSVKRSIAGRVVLPVMTVNGIKQLIDGKFITFVTTTTTTDGDDILASGALMKIDKISFFDNTHANNVERLMIIKSLLFVMVMAKLAFQGDDTCVGENEWFPWQRNCDCSGGSVDEKKSEVKKD